MRPSTTNNEHRIEDHKPDDFVHFDFSFHYDLFDELNLEKTHRVASNEQEIVMVVIKRSQWAQHNDLDEYGRL